MADGLGFAKRRLIDTIINQSWNMQNPKGKIFTYNELLFVIQEMLTNEGKAYIEQATSINYGYHAFREFVKMLLYRNLANYDSMILMSAEKGVGKSSAAIMIAREWCKLIGIKFDPKRHMAYTNADMMNKIDILGKFEPLIADEAVRFASAEDWAKKSNKELRKKLAQVRTKHLLYILCFPLKIMKLEKNYLESYTNYWIDLYARGKGVVYVKDRNPAQDAWRINAFLKLGSYNEFTASHIVLEKLKKHPNFWMGIKFPKPPKWLYDKYLAVREQNVYDDQNIINSLSKDDLAKALLILALRDIMSHDDTLSINRIILHIKNEYDIPLNRNIIEGCIEDSKQMVIALREKFNMSLDDLNKGESTSNE
jgi:hypothetical protein